MDFASVGKCPEAESFPDPISGDRRPGVARRRACRVASPHRRQDAAVIRGVIWKAAVVRTWAADGCSAVRSWPVLRRDGVCTDEPAPSVAGSHGATGYLCAGPMTFVLKRRPYYNSMRV